MGIKLILTPDLIQEYLRREKACNPAILGNYKHSTYQEKALNAVLYCRSQSSGFYSHV